MSSAPSIFTRFMFGLGLGAGCEQVSTVLTDEATEIAEQLVPPESVGPSSPARTPAQALEQKLKLYRECLDRAHAAIDESGQRYREYHRDDGTPRSNETPPFIHTIDSELTPCAHATVHGPTIEPALPMIEQAMSEAFRHAQTYARLSQELDTYYQQQGYAEDDGAKAKEIAAPLLASLDSWSAAQRRLETRLIDEQERVDTERLHRIEQERGQNLQWHVLHLRLAAGALMKCMQDPSTTASGCDASWDALDRAHQDFIAAYHANEDEVASIFWMSAFHNSALAFHAAAKPTKASRKSGPTVELSRAFDALLSDANNLRFPT